MSETKTQPISVEEGMQAIAELEARLEEQRQERTVMFIDLVGYTAFTDRHGDLAGLRRVETASKIVIPTCESFEGHKVKQIGDEWMFLFIDPLRAVQAAMEIHERMARTQKDAPNPIRIKIGAHFGKLLLHAQDAFGDVVNVASRLVRLCTGDDILISRSVYDEVGPFYQRRCHPLPELRLRGKADLAEAYELDWKKLDVAVAGEEDPSRLTLEVRWSDRTSSITLQSSSEENAPLVSKEDHPILEKDIAEISHALWETVRSANLSASGKRSSTTLEQLGKQLFELLFPPTVQDRLREAEEEFLVLDLDDSCVHVPWEALHDGTDFLCCRFSIGRKARTGQKTRGRSRTAPVARYSMLLVSDPTGDLPAASEEGKTLYNLCRRDRRVRLNWQNDRVTPEKIREYLPEYDVLHYCGHAEHVVDHPDRSGWVLSGGDFKASDLEVFMREDRPIPRLVFNNACHSGTTGSWRDEATGWSHGLANAFLLAGCVHYIGAVAELLDRGSKEFSRFFYREVMAGHPIGRALRKARNEYRKAFGSENLTWVQYVLYGRPEAGLFLLPKPIKNRDKIAPQRHLKTLLDTLNGKSKRCKVYVWTTTSGELGRSNGNGSQGPGKVLKLRDAHSPGTGDKGNPENESVVSLFDEGLGELDLKPILIEASEALGFHDVDSSINRENGSFVLELDNAVKADRFATTFVKLVPDSFKTKEILTSHAAYERLPNGARPSYGPEQPFEEGQFPEIRMVHVRKNLMEAPQRQWNRGFGFGVGGNSWKFALSFGATLALFLLIVWVLVTQIPGPPGPSDPERQQIVENPFAENVLKALAEGNLSAAGVLIQETSQSNLANHPLTHLAITKFDWMSGKTTEETSALLEKVTENPGTIDSHKAQAWLLLGRIAAASKDYETALDYMTKAADLGGGTGSDLERKRLLGDKGLMLVKMNEFEGALGAYEEALEVDPDDRPLQWMKRSCLAKIQKARDSKKQEEDKEWMERTREALKNFKETLASSPRRNKDYDPWTSRPVGLALLGIEWIGEPPEYLSEEEIFANELEFGFYDTDRWFFVERDKLEFVMQESELSATELTDEEYAVRVGHFLPARGLLTAQVIKREGASRVTTRVIDTETRRIAAMSTQSTTGELADVAPMLIEDLVARLERDYEIRGRIVDATGEMATLNIGSLQGVRAGQKFQVYIEESHPRAADRVVGLKSVGELEVVDVGETGAECAVVRADLPLAKDMRAREE